MKPMAIKRRTRLTALEVAGHYLYGVLRDSEPVMSTIEALRNKGEWTSLERCIIETWEINGLEYLADEAAAELAQLRKELDEAKEIIKKAQPIVDYWIGCDEDAVSVSIRMSSWLKNAGDE